MSTPSPLQIGRWTASAIPPGWTLLPDYGLRRSRDGALPSHIGIAQDTLLAGNRLDLYLQAQITLLQRTFAEPLIAGPLPSTFPGADEAMLLMIRHRPLYGPAVLQVQHYIRALTWIGIVTLTAPEHDVLAVRPDFDTFLRALSITPEPTAASPA